jgi:hypothetical protein
VVDAPADVPMLVVGLFEGGTGGAGCRASSLRSSAACFGATAVGCSVSSLTGPVGRPTVESATACAVSSFVTVAHEKRSAEAANTAINEENLFPEFEYMVCLLCISRMILMSESRPPEGWTRVVHVPDAAPSRV